MLSKKTFFSVEKEELYGVQNLHSRETFFQRLLKKKHFSPDSSESKEISSSSLIFLAIYFLWQCIYISLKTVEDNSYYPF